MLFNLKPKGRGVKMVISDKALDKEGLLKGLIEVDGNPVLKEVYPRMIELLGEVHSERKTEPEDIAEIFYTVMYECVDKGQFDPVALITDKAGEIAAVFIGDSEENKRVWKILLCKMMQVVPPPD